MTGDAGQAAKLCGTKPLGIEPRPRAKFTLATKSFGRLRGCGVVDGISRLQIATDAKTLQQRDQLIDRLMAQLPNPPAAAGTIAIRQLREFEVRFLQQQRRARCCAAAPDVPRLPEPSWICPRTQRRAPPRLRSFRHPQQRQPCRVDPTAPDIVVGLVRCQEATEVVRRATVVAARSTTAL